MHQYTIKEILLFTQSLLKDVNKTLASKNQDVKTALVKVDNALNTIEEKNLKALIEYKDSLDNLFKQRELRILEDIDDYGKLDKS
ncbi:hypothetical protein [Nostoc favosum]|uniref:Uncharacterized protein n=1 Tax=Nostoc favosum CHAB5714 TaxID=2780399 RepID=A0ABS8I4E8_9NOSO|nr:hypothetical protein [Nostoc favosum]MCC5599060.1 hypothetical protein [Nostoc favosum CHAB5714]